MASSEIQIKIDLLEELVNVQCLTTECKYSLRYKGLICCGLKNIQIKEGKCESMEVKQNIQDR